MAALFDVYGRILFNYTPKEGEEDTLANALTVAALRRVKLPMLDVRNQVLDNLNLSELIAPYADFSNATIHRVDFSNALLEGAFFTDASIEDVVARGATIDEAGLRGAKTLVNIIRN